MKFKYIACVLIVLIGCSCIQQNSRSKVQIQKKSNQNLDWNSGVRIENGLIHGFDFTNSKGIQYGHACETNTIYNDNTDSVQLKFDLTNEYKFPAPHNNQEFKVVIWPHGLTPKKVLSTDSLSNELNYFLEYGLNTSSNLSIAIAPKENYVLTIGTLVDKVSNMYASPNRLYVLGDGSVPGQCKNLANQHKSTHDSNEFGLRVDIPNLGCRIITCGQISYTIY